METAVHAARINLQELPPDLECLQQHTEAQNACSSGGIYPRTS